MLSESIMIDRTGNFTASSNFRLMAGWEKPAPEIDFKLFEDLTVADDLHDIMVNLYKKPLIKDFSDFSVKVTGAMINNIWALIQYDKPSTGLVTYAEEKACESLFDYDPSLNFSTVHTRNGDERELACMEKLSEATGLDFINTGDNQAHIHANEIGCTPDGIVLDELDMILTGAEVKCKTPLEHSKLLLLNNNDDLKREAFDHFVQVQTQMLVTGSDHWYFATYNPFGKTKVLRFKYIIIGRDNDFIAIMQDRIDTAKVIKNKYLDKINKIMEPQLLIES